MLDLETDTRRNTAGLVEGRPTLGASERRARSLREGANGPAILQADLQRLESVNQRRKQLDLEYADLRDSILDRYREGGPIEAGGLMITVSDSWVRHFSNDQLVRILGEDETEQLKGRLSPSLQTSLKITRP